MFRVRWQKSVSLKLLNECARADSALLNAILNAMSEVEATLQNEPEFAGESRESGRRFLIVDPLSVRYTIDNRNRIVLIIGAWIHNTKK
jgi:hypothetical protein